MIITPTQPPPIRVTSRTGPIPVVTTPIQPVNVTMPTGKPGPQGPPGADALWTSMTRAEFDALPVKDPNTLYVIIG